MRIPIPSIVTRLLTPQNHLEGDTERGYGNGPAGMQQSTLGVGASTLSPAPMSTTAPRNPRAQETLQEFRHYMGIQNDPDLVEANRPVPNLGIYQRIVKAEKLYKDQYKIYSTLINSALGLQIIFGAALTALGAGSGPHSAVTAFGAMNTILASVLTFLKGSGLPNRMKYYHNELQKVREYIEQREREFARGAMELDLKAEVAVIEEMYESVKRDIEINTPDAYVSTTSRGNPQPPPPLGNRYAIGAHQLEDPIHDMSEKYRGVRRGLESRLSQTKLGAEARIHSLERGLSERALRTRADFDNEMNSARMGLESRLSQERMDMESRYNDTKRGLSSQVQQAQDSIDNTRRGFAAQAQQSQDYFNNARTATQARAEDQINTARLATAAQVEDTRHGLESQLESTRAGVSAQVEETRHGMESRLKEVQAQVKDQEEKILGIAENVAEKVLSFTQSRREHDQG